VTAAARFAELNKPSEVALPTEVIAPVKLALVVTLPAVKPAAVPVMFVPTKVDGVPRFGVTKVGEVAKTLSPVPVLATLTTCLLALSAKAVEAVRPDSVIPGIVAFVAESKYTARSDGWVQITSFKPVTNGTKIPALLEAKTVSRLKVLPDELYVPTPTSQAPVFASTMA
jgi:hypothetical protein